MIWAFFLEIVTFFHCFYGLRGHIWYNLRNASLKNVMGGSFDYDISVNTSSLEAQLVSSVFQNVASVSSLNFTQSALTELMNFDLGDSTTSVSQVSVIVIGI